MVQALNRSRAKRTPPSLADQLYPQDGLQDAGPDEEGEADVPEETGAPRTPLQRAADSLYPEKGENASKEEEDTGETGRDAGDAGGGQEDEGDSDDEDSDDEGSDDEGSDDEGSDDEGSDDEQLAQRKSGQTAQLAVSRLHAVMGLYGINMNPKEGRGDAEQLAKIEDGLQNEIALTEAKKGSALTPDEEMNITLAYIADHQVEIFLADSGSERDKNFNERHCKLSDLTPELSPFIKEVLLRMELKGWRPKIQQTKRTTKEEEEHMKDGTSGLHDPKKSKHYDLGTGADAVDITDSRYGWGSKNKSNEGQAQAFFKDLGASLEETKKRWGDSAARFQWGGYWHRPYDPAHIENTKRVTPLPQGQNNRSGNGKIKS